VWRYREIPWQRHHHKHLELKIDMIEHKYIPFINMHMFNALVFSRDQIHQLKTSNTNRKQSATGTKPTKPSPQLTYPYEYTQTYQNQTQSRINTTQEFKTKKRRVQRICNPRAQSNTTRIQILLLHFIRKIHILDGLLQLLDGLDALGLQESLRQRLTRTLIDTPP
jgi:hypothetical protein